MAEEEYSWSPPSEAELKVIEARRERNNKISSLMGQYLLKGYKMLATTCPVCECVLLEDRNKHKYCVGCCEVDADTRKDNPAVNEVAARRAVQENQHRQQPKEETNASASHTLQTSSHTLQTSSHTLQTSSHTQQTPTPECSPRQPQARTDSSVGATALLSVATSTSESTSPRRSLHVHGVDLHDDVRGAVDALRGKLAWAVGQLQATSSLHEAQGITAFISEACRAIAALRDL